jgi:limonene-1,2-epoxide hydrolase
MQITGKRIEHLVAALSKPGTQKGEAKYFQTCTYSPPFGAPNITGVYITQP